MVREMTNLFDEYFHRPDVRAEVARLTAESPRLRAERHVVTLRRIAREAITRAHAAEALAASLYGELAQARAELQRAREARVA